MFSHKILVPSLFEFVQTPRTVGEVDLPSGKTRCVLGEPTRAPPPPKTIGKTKKYWIRVMPRKVMSYYQIGIAYVSSKFIIRPYRFLTSSYEGLVKFFIRIVIYHIHIGIVYDV